MRKLATPLFLLILSLSNLSFFGFINSTSLAGTNNSAFSLQFFQDYAVSQTISSLLTGAESKAQKQSVDRFPLQGASLTYTASKSNNPIKKLIQIFKKLKKSSGGGGGN